MSTERAVPIAIGLVASLVLLALGLGRRWRGSASVWIVLVPAVTAPLAAGLFALQLVRSSHPRALEALSAGALSAVVALNALAALGKASLFALPLAAAATITLRNRVALIGHGARHRIPALVGAIVVLVGAVALLRVDLATALRHASVVSPPSAAAPTSVAVRPTDAALRRGRPTTMVSPESHPTDAAGDAAAASAAGPHVAEESVSFEPVRVNGMLMPEVVQTHVERTRRRIEECQENAKSPGEGQLIVGFMVGEKGSVSRVWQREAASSLEPAFVSCVLTAFYRVGFPTPTRGSVRVEVPINIRKR
jgi:hypothetical protein